MIEIPSQKPTEDTLLVDTPLIGCTDVRPSESGGSGTTLSSTDDLPEGTTNLYFSGKTTDNLTEGSSNLYYSDTLVSANTDVAANTAARHSAVTVTDSSTIDFTLTGQDITGSVLSQYSITSDSNGLKLVNDSATPGNSKLYGTNSSGVLGWYDQPTAGTPTAHASTHEDGGADEISVAGLSGLLADAQTPLSHVTSHENGGSDELDVTGLSGLLADPQNPLSHASSHEAGGSDEVNHDNLTGYVAAEHIDWSVLGTEKIYSGRIDIFTTTKSGLVPNPGVTGTNLFLRQDATWAEPAYATYTGGDGIAINGSNVISVDYNAVNFTIDAGKLKLAPGGVSATELAESYELDLGLPSTDGYVLSSTTGGVRSWVDVATQSELDSVESNLQSQINNKDNYQYWIAKADGDATGTNITSTSILDFTAGARMTVSRTGNTITFTADDQSTSYSAGNAIDISSNTINVLYDGVVIDVNGTNHLTIPDGSITPAKFDDTYMTQTWSNSVTQTEMGYLHGVTSDIQTQLNSKTDAYGTPLDNQVAVWRDANTLEGSTNLTFNGTSLYVGGDLVVDEGHRDMKKDPQGLSTTGSVTWNLASGYNAHINGITGNITLSFSNLENGDSGTLMVKHNSTTTYTITLPTNSIIGVAAGNTVSISSSSTTKWTVLGFVYDSTLSRIFWTETTYTEAS